MDDVTIEKPDFQVLLSNHISFTTIPNDILQNYMHESIRLWIYLISLPPNFKITRKFLERKFDIGRDKLSTWLKMLKTNYLISHLWIKNTNGTVKNVFIKVHDGNLYRENILNKQEHKEVIHRNDSTILENQCLAEPVCGFSVVCKDINTNTKQKNKEKERDGRAGKAPRFSLSDLVDFKANENNQELLKKTSDRTNHSPEVLLSKFKAVMRERGKESKDWQASLEKFLLNERSREKKLPVSELRSTVPEVKITVETPEQRAKRHAEKEQPDSGYQIYKKAHPHFGARKPNDIPIS